jgi:hypothetical protein
MALTALLCGRLVLGITCTAIIDLMLTMAYLQLLYFYKRYRNFVRFDGGHKTGTSGWCHI